MNICYYYRCHSLCTSPITQPMRGPLHENHATGRCMKTMRLWPAEFHKSVKSVQQSIHPPRSTAFSHSASVDSLPTAFSSSASVGSLKSLGQNDRLDMLNFSQIAKVFQDQRGTAKAAFVDFPQPTQASKSRIILLFQIALAKQSPNAHSDTQSQSFSDV